MGNKNNATCTVHVYTVQHTHTLHMYNVHCVKSKFTHPHAKLC